MTKPNLSSVIVVAVIFALIIVYYLVFRHAVLR